MKRFPIDPIAAKYTWKHESVALSLTGSDNSDMEHRVTALEEAVKSIRDDVKAIKWNIWLGALTIWASVIVMGLAIQQMTVSTFQGAAEVARASATAVAPPAQLMQPAVPAPSAPVVPSKPGG